MFIAMNRFQVAGGQGEHFETMWRERESQLNGVPGFVRFALLKGDREGEYISHSTWESRAAFDTWTESQAFTDAHRGGSLAGVLATHPELGLYEAVLEQEAAPS